MVKLNSRVFMAKKPPKQTGKGFAGYDNPRDNIDPHVKTGVVTTKEITLSDGTSAGFVMNDANGVLSGGHAGGGGSSDHSTLTNLEWSTAGHTIDTNFIFDTDDSYTLGSTTVAPSIGYFRKLAVSNAGTIAAPTTFQPFKINIEESSPNKTVEGMTIVVENTDTNLSSSVTGIDVTTKIESTQGGGSILIGERDTSGVGSAILNGAIIIDETYSSGEVDTSIGASFSLESTGVTRASNLTGMILSASGATTTNTALQISDGDIVMDNATDKIAGIENQNLVDKSATETISDDWTWIDNKDVKFGSSGDVSCYYNGSDDFIVLLGGHRMRMTGKTYTNASFSGTVHPEKLIDAQAQANGSVASSARELLGLNIDVIDGATAGRGVNYVKKYGGRVIARAMRNNAIAYTGNPFYVGGDFRASYTGTGVLTATGNPVVFRGGEFIANATSNPASPMTIGELTGGSFSADASAAMANLTVTDARGGLFNADVSGTGVTVTRNYGILVKDVIGGSTMWGVNIDTGSDNKVALQISSDDKLCFEGDETTQGDTYMVYDSGNSTLDVFVGGVEVFNSSATESQFTQDVIFTGDGSGIPYGHMYTNSTIAVTISTINTPTEVGDTWTTGELNLVTFGSSHYLTVSKAGRYKIDWNMCIVHPAGVAQIAVAGVMINGTAATPGRTMTNILNSIDPRATSGTVILDLAANDQVSLFVMNTSGSGDLDVEYGNVSVIMVGGT